MTHSQMYNEYEFHKLREQTRSQQYEIGGLKQYIEELKFRVEWLEEELTGRSKDEARLLDELDTL